MQGFSSSPVRTHMYQHVIFIIFLLWSESFQAAVVRSTESRKKNLCVFICNDGNLDCATSHSYQVFAEVMIVGVVGG